MKTKGVGASAGIGIGKVVKIHTSKPDLSTIVVESEREELARFEKGSKKFIQKMQHLSAKTEKKLGKEHAAIFDSQIMLLKDEELQEKVREAIAKGSSASQAVYDVTQYYAQKLAKVDNPFIRQRAADALELQEGMIKILFGMQDTSGLKQTEPTILVLDELTPTIAAQLDTTYIVGIVTEKGGFYGHALILARQMAVPVIFGKKNAMSVIPDGSLLAIDGISGELEWNPPKKALARWREKEQDWLRHQDLLSSFRTKPSVGRDGRSYQIMANINSVEEAGMAAEIGADGIGLFRTEFLFLERTKIPSEEEQFQAYLQVSELMKDKPVTIRTLDVGGDKPISYLHLPVEANPYLGYRAIRYGLEHPGEFKIQLRAILRAGAQHRNLSIMIPFITSVEEVRKTKELVEECKKELREQGIAFDENCRLGIMIETPSAALMARELAQEVSFFSIGTNDLTQYVLSCDRSNASVAGIYSAFQPAVLRAIGMTIEAANEAGIEVSMCGEAAASAPMIAILSGWGLTRLSVGLNSVWYVRERVTNVTKEEGQQLARKVSVARTHQEVMDIVKNKKSTMILDKTEQNKENEENGYVENL
ncbi:phosphoenolpyruvate--protein phosphotransferase [Eubacterium oxidoreducens]|uniref:Phosphoenolpyruvate-protein phosphotransferase n=1 Tax=Eubacterium oxidoreducens TaxID=1732 RepID=A0A1G6AAP1_EUBOX|nr:phosphoenolpyruvate--protein phosphotransferase [Eubacterium oxidoreducens]SDB05481.1 phosphotransferase system, enzyme I, PtsI [Eubacterium oxidoreducens]